MQLPAACRWVWFGERTGFLKHKAAAELPVREAAAGAEACVCQQPADGAAYRVPLAHLFTRHSPRPAAFLKQFDSDWASLLASMLRALHAFQTQLWPTKRRANVSWKPPQ